MNHSRQSKNTKTINQLRAAIKANLETIQAAKLPKPAKDLEKIQAKEGRRQAWEARKIIKKEIRRDKARDPYEYTSRSIIFCKEQDQAFYRSSTVNQIPVKHNSSYRSKDASSQSRLNTRANQSGEMWKVSLDPWIPGEDYAVVYPQKEEEDD